jgi:hypothetical protein
MLRNISRASTTEAMTENLKLVAIIGFAVANKRIFRKAPLLIELLIPRESSDVKWAI